MSEIKLKINNTDVSGEAGQTILEIAKNNGIDIPTLCHDERVKIFGSCGVCTVEMEGSPRLFRSCSTFASDGMIIFTETERVRRNRKAAFELLLSDHIGDCKPPCMLACPAETDCQGYVREIANGDDAAAKALVMETNPFPASIGRVCPHPCEEACRRSLVEEPIAIAHLKSFAANSSYQPEFSPSSTGKSVAVIGGGPGGLAAAYFLRREGHFVAVYDAQPQMGGMLRYGIPEYRLPKQILDGEIEVIKGYGIEFHNNVRIGTDMKFDEFKAKYDAVIVAMGAWTSSGLRCKGEELEGSIGGIEFLCRNASGNLSADYLSNKTVAIVGGGNTAMDACRTAVRLGARKVYNIYRRTRNEMPAEEIEIIEAEEEGVIFLNLRNPLELIGNADGRVKAVRLQVMELGEPDASGRRSPVAVEGKEEIIDADIVIAAIGQKLNPSGFESLELTKWGTISACENTFRTNIKNVYAIGDATNKGADIAISAIGEARKCATIVNQVLRGEEPSFKSKYLSKTEKTAADFADKEKISRVVMPHRSPDIRNKDFLEVNLGLAKEEAQKEAKRCLECGCLDYYECKLIKYANDYEVNPDKFAGLINKRKENHDIPDVLQTPDKCVLCGLCVRLCNEEIKAGILGFVGRGFDTYVEPAGGLDVCRGCAKCAIVCPTGALIKMS